MSVIIDEVSVIEVTVIEPTAGKRGTTMDATGKTTLNGLAFGYGMIQLEQIDDAVGRLARVMN